MLLLAAFVQIERRARSPCSIWAFFAVTLFSAAAVSAVLNYTCTAMVTFLMPFYLITVARMEPVEGRLAPHHPTSADGDHRADERHGFRPARPLAAAGDRRHGNPHRWALAGLPA